MFHTVLKTEVGDVSRGKLVPVAVEVPYSVTKEMMAKATEPLVNDSIANTIGCQPWQR